MMYAMLKPNGVLAICIDDNELFHLGIMLDEIFGEKNRIGIINWQKSAAARPDNSHISTATEYILIYAKDKDLAKTASMERSEKDNRRYDNRDGDPDGAWREGNLTARSYSIKSDYGIQSPFTGEVHYPAGNGAWRHPKRNIVQWLEMWGASYEEREIGDGRRPALMVKGQQPNQVDQALLRRAEEILKSQPWPFVWFGADGLGRPRVKTYLNKIRKGKVPTTYWADEEFDADSVPDIELGSTSWDYEESGRSADGVNELNAIVGKGHGFDTVKPLKLFKKIIQLWCPPSGLVLDPYAGSGTTGHAVLELNNDAGADRRFILIEQGEPDRGDKYARSLTRLRLRNAITGERPGAKRAAEPLTGGFQFRLLTKKIDSRAVLSMRKDELIDLVITSHWENNRRSSAGLIRFENAGYKYLVGRNEQNEGYFLIWNGGNEVGHLDETSHAIVVDESKRAGLKQPYHVYARYETYQSRNVIFYKIPDKILAHLGLNESSDSFNEEEED